MKQTFGLLTRRSGTNKINQPTFVQYWTDYVDPIIADRLWLVFDTKYDSFLDFEEWAIGLSNTLRGNKEDRIKRTCLGTESMYHCSILAFRNEIRLKSLSSRSKGEIFGSSRIVLYFTPSPGYFNPDFLKFS